MNRHALERFLFEFDKRPELVDAFRLDPQKSLEGQGLSTEEQEALEKQDVATLYQWGVHPLLIRNFAGTIGVRYVPAYRARGLHS